MVHLLAMTQLVHHHHLYVLEREPVAGIRRFENQLDDFAGVEVASHKLEVGRVLFKCHDGEMVGFHDWVADCGYALEVVECKGRVRTRERLDEYYSRVGLEAASIEALDTEGHLGGGDESF